MNRWLKLCTQGTRFCLECAGSFALWSLWLALTLLLGVQIYIAAAHELEVPGFLLRRIEERLAQSGLQAQFARTAFDPQGRFLIEDLRLSTPAFADPVVSARTVYVSLNPWLLAVGWVEPREIRISGATLAVPAIFSPDARPEVLVRDLDATLVPAGPFVELRQLSARVAGVTLTARGTFRPPAPGRRPADDAVAVFLREHFPVLCRKALALAEHASQLEQPALDLRLEPSASGALRLEAALLARRAWLETPLSVRASDVSVKLRLLLLGDEPATPVEFTAAEIELPRTSLRGVHAVLHGRFRPGAPAYEPRELAVTLDHATVDGIASRAIAAQVFPRPWPRIDFATVGTFDASPLAVRADADLTARRAQVAFEGELSPAVLDTLSRRLGVRVQRFFSYEKLAVDRATARFGDGWKFERLDARLRLDGIDAYGVRMSDGRVVAELEPGRFRSPDVSARLGESFARGSYDHDFRTRAYRFLLDGRVRPLELSPWFKPWWSDFFATLAFPSAPAPASVDVRGVWLEGLQSAVFVFADTVKPVVRGTAFDRVRTRLFIRPGFFDGLELHAERGESTARGTFAYRLPTDAPGWTSLDLDFASTFDLETVGTLLGPSLAKTLAPIRVTGLPDVKLSGRFTGPASPEGSHQSLRIEAETAGEFRYHGFPVNDASFTAILKDDDFELSGFAAEFAGGEATIDARVWNQGGTRRLGFDFSLTDAYLGRAVGTLQEFFAGRRGEPPPPPGKFVQERVNVKLDIAASGEGDYEDAFSYRGEGNARLHGAEIGEVPLLGLLSELLRFTTLLFNEAQTNFRIEGPRLVFPEVTLRGSNAAIDAHGSYAIDRRELDFNAKLFPFQESENILKSVVGAVLTPFSNALEVKLGGSIDEPSWRLVLGPSNFLRSLGGENAPAAPPAAPEPAPAVPAPPVTPP